MTVLRAPPRRPGLLFAVLTAAGFGVPAPASGQAGVRADPPPFDLASLFETGNLVLDENGDGFPDRLGATLWIGSAAGPSAQAAAAEVAARLGFETMGLDLPVARGSQAGRVAVLVGAGAVTEAGLSVADFGGRGSGCRNWQGGCAGNRERPLGRPARRRRRRTSPRRPLSCRQPAPCAHAVGPVADHRRRGAGPLASRTRQRRPRSRGRSLRFAPVVAFPLARG